jgi:hypothetical protein
MIYLCISLLYLRSHFVPKIIYGEHQVQHLKQSKRNQASEQDQLSVVEIHLANYIRVIGII